MCNHRNECANPDACEPKTLTSATACMEAATSAPAGAITGNIDARHPELFIPVEPVQPGLPTVAHRFSILSIGAAESDEGSGGAGSSEGQRGGDPTGPALAQPLPDTEASADGGIRAATNTSVWVTGQVCSRDQRRGRYVPGSIYHPGKMLPSIARQAIAEYTAAGDIVADPMCGIGTTLIEAMHAGRIGVGVEYEKRWAELAHQNIEFAASQGATGQAIAWHGDGRDIAQLVPENMRGKVALVITSPPYGPSTHGRAYTGNRRVGRKVLKAHHKYGDSPGNLAYTRHTELAAGFTDILKSCAAILRPGGFVAITARPYRTRGELVDIPGMVITAGQTAGLTLIDRKAALLCGVRDGRLVPRSSFFQIKNVRQAHDDASAPLHVVQHEDLIIFSALESGSGGRS